MNYREQISKGKCVSPYTTDRCPVCVDVCEAFKNKVDYDTMMKDNDIESKL